MFNLMSHIPNFDYGRDIIFLELCSSHPRHKSVLAIFLSNNFPSLQCFRSPIS